MNGDWTEVAPNASGVHIVEVAQDERIEVRLPSSDDAYASAQIVNGERRPLPLGSSLDAEKGIFYWQPAPGFLGAFDLEFVRSVRLPPSREADVVRVRVVVGPSIRMAIDTPQSGATVDQPFLLSGWALDLAALDNSGVDAVSRVSISCRRRSRNV